jgi:hypothetical protein
MHDSLFGNYFHDMVKTEQAYVRLSFLDQIEKEQFIDSNADVSVSNFKNF